MLYGNGPCFLSEAHDAVADKGLAPYSEGLDAHIGGLLQQVQHAQKDAQ